MSDELLCPSCDERIPLRGKPKSRCPACNASLKSESARGSRDEDDERPAKKKKYRKDWDDDDDDDDDRPTRSRPAPRSGGSGVGTVFIVLGSIAVVVLLVCGGFAWWIVSMVKQKQQEIIARANAPGDPFNNPEARPRAPMSLDASAYPKRKPFDLDPILANGPNPTFLDSLAPFDVQQGGWKLGRNGALGDNDGRWVVVNRVYYEHSLSMHPPDNGTARASFAVGGQAKTLRGSVALNDDYGAAWEDCTFAIYKDGKEIWRSQPIKNRNIVIPFNVNVTGARVIMLETQCKGSSHNGHCVWLDPVLDK